MRCGVERVTWTPDLMIAPLDARIASALSSVTRRAALRRGRGRTYRFDLGCLRRRFPWERMPGPPVPRTVQELLRPPGGRV